MLNALKKRYRLYDPGFSQLFLGLRAVTTLFCIIVIGHHIFAADKASILFVAMASVFSMVNLYSPTVKENLKSVVRASAILYSAVFFGLYFPFPAAFKLPVFLFFVFVSYYLTYRGPRWKFHPVVASIILMVSMSVPVESGKLSSLWHYWMFCFSSVSISIFFQFVVFKNQIRFGAEHSVLGVLSALEETYSYAGVNRQQAKLVWKQANVKTNQLIGFGRKLNINVKQKKEMELFVIELYGLVRLTLNLLDSIKELESTFFQYPHFKKEICFLLSLLADKVAALSSQKTILSAKYDEGSVLLNALLSTLPSDLSKEALSPLYLFCFSYQKSTKFIELLGDKLQRFAEVR